MNKKWRDEQRKQEMFVKRYAPWNFLSQMLQMFEEKIILGNCYLNNWNWFGTFDPSDFDPVTQKSIGFIF